MSDTGAGKTNRCRAGSGGGLDVASGHPLDIPVHLARENIREAPGLR